MFGLDLFPLNIFPTGGLASSVITTVWIGVTVVALLNLRFGTTLSGLVVPGYIVPLLLVKPVAAGVIIVESLVTYLLARVIADRLLVKFGLGEFFGRDRFFMLILISVLVRVIFDAYLLVAVDDWLLQQGIDYEFRSSLHSFGLIIIALTANQFWNSGLKRGAITLTIHLVLTYAIISYLLIPLTNFNISTLGYMYEDVASNILASPKAYIILILAAFLSSRLNLRYGWDFNGILIPSLLALQWYNPIKIVTTFVEAFVILFAAILLLRLPPLRNLNIEGARQLLLFFNIGFVYKLLLGFAIIAWFPSQKITDMYGFGYLLATLLAIKMYQKDIAIKLTRTTIQTSLMASIFASAVGFAFTLYQPTANLNLVKISTATDIDVSEQSLTTVLERTRRQSFSTESVQKGYVISPNTLDEFRTTIIAIDSLSDSPSTEQLNGIATLADRFNYQALWVDSRYLVLRDRNPARGWGFFVIDLKQPNRLGLQFPTQMNEVSSAMVMVPLLKQLNARYLAVASARSNRAKDGSDQLLLNSQTLFQTFHQRLTLNNALQVRQYTPSLARELLGERSPQASISTLASEPTMWIKSQPPEGLSLQTLQRISGDIELIWGKPDLQNRQREVSRYGFAELFLNDEATLAILSSAAQNQRVDQIASEQHITGYLQSYLQRHRNALADKYTQHYQAASQAELLYFDSAILTPLYDVIARYNIQNWQQQTRALLNQIAAAAAQFNYQLILYQHEPSLTNYLILQEQIDSDPENNRYWGTFVFTLGPTTPYMIQAPNAATEIGTFEFAGALFQQIDAAALVISGAHPDTNRDGSAQLTARDNPLTLFNMVHQSFLREHRDNGITAVQIRGYTSDSSRFVSAQSEQQEASTTLTDSVKFGIYEQYKPFAEQEPMLIDLRQYLSELLQQQGAAQAQQPIPLVQASYTAQGHFTKFIPSAHYAEVWLPRGLRESYTVLEPDSQLYQQLNALGLPVQSLDVIAQASTRPLATLSPAQLQATKSLLLQFEQSQNIQALATLQAQLSNHQLAVWRDKRSLQSYLVITNNDDELVLLKNLNPLNDNNMIVAPNTALTQQLLNRFVQARGRWLYKELTQ